MNKYNSKYELKVWWLSVFGLLMIALAGFGWSGTTAEIRSDAPTVFNSDGENLTLGRLAYEFTYFITFGSNTAVNTAAADGSNAVQLNTGGIPSFNGQPAWSPDGAKIAYVANLAPNFDIYVMNADGSNKIQITNSTANEVNPSWSAAGKIAYERDGQIWTMNADGSNQMVFSAITQPSPAAPAWSPDGSKMAFASGGEIWVINADGSGERRVTNNSTADADPAWSPDGAKIIFGKGGSGIAVINLDGTNETTLTSGGLDGKPAWSSDGTRIAFVRRGAAENGIFVMDASGANQIRILADVPNQPGRSINDNPAWQPVAAPPNTYTINGRITRTGASLGGVTVNLSGTTTATTTTDRLGFYQFGSLPQNGNFLVTPVLANHIFTPPVRAFSNLTANQIADFAAGETCSTPNCRLNGKIAFVRLSAEIYTINPDGTNQTNITNNVANDTDPNYSPDGSKIVFASNRDGNFKIYQMNADGSAVVRLTNNQELDSAPAFSPDGLSIVFISNRDGNHEIYKMNADGTNQVRLTNAPTTDRVPSFSPDGAKIIFVRDTPVGFLQIFTMNSDGTNQLALTNPGAFYNRPSYSPDGTKIIFVYGEGSITAQTIYTMNADGTNRVQFPVGRSSPTYSPDGTRVVYVCCFGGGQLQDGVRAANANGTSAVSLTLGAFDDFPAWQPLRPAARRTPFDFDGDGRADVSVFRPSSGIWYLLNSQAGFTGFQFGIAADKLVPADYDGDGKTDAAVYRSGVWYLQRSQLGFIGIAFGATDDIPVPADYDGDGKSDVAVFRQSNGTWYLLQSTNGFAEIRFGLGTDKPVPADYDGDGKANIAVFRPSNGTWYTSTNPAINYGAVLFGTAEDKPVPADYDGDGKSDVAVFRPSNGTWYLLRSQLGFTGIAFGFGNDLSAPADYDGDGKADVAVFRSGIWYLQRTTAGFTGISFGAAGDKPVPNALVP